MISILVFIRKPKSTKKQDTTQIRRVKKQLRQITGFKKNKFKGFKPFSALYSKKIFRSGLKLKCATTAFGSATTAFGSATTAFGNATSAFGSATTAFGNATTAFGSATTTCEFSWHADLR